MAFRSIRFLILHAARAAGVSGLSASHTIATANPLYLLIDDLRGVSCKFSASGSGRHFQIDRGAAGLEAIDRLIIPAGHNLSGQTVTVKSDTTTAFAPGTTRGTSGTLTSAQVDFALTPYTDRYTRVEISGTGTWEVPELVLTRTRTPTAGIAGEYQDDDLPNVVPVVTRSGTVATLVRGEAGRVWRVEWQLVDGSVDKALFLEVLAAQAAGLVLYIDPPDDSEAAVPVIVSDVSRTQDHPNPKSGGIAYRYTMTLSEALG